MSTFQEYIIHCSVYATENNRLDKYLVDLIEFTPLTISRTQITRLCKILKVNGKIVKRSYKIQKKDELYIVLQYTSDDIQSISLEYDSNIDYTEDYNNLDILLEDEHFLVVNKSRGMVVHPGAGHQEGTLSQIVFSHLTNYREEDLFQNRAGIVHRLDKETSGVIILAKRAHMHDKLAKLFSQREISKRYIAIVHPVPQNRVGSIQTYIGRHSIDRKKFSVVANEKKGKFAHTDYRIIYNNEHYAVLVCNIYTGRTHQIRVHMQHIGSPVVGDILYSRHKVKYADIHNQEAIANSYVESSVDGNNDNYSNETSRPVYYPLMLHAYELEFDININNEIAHYQITAAIPDDMLLFLKYIGAPKDIEELLAKIKS